MTIEIINKSIEILIICTTIIFWFRNIYEVARIENVLNHKVLTDKIKQDLHQHLAILMWAVLISMPLLYIWHYLILISYVLFNSFIVFPHIQSENEDYINTLKCKDE